MHQIQYRQKDKEEEGTSAFWSYFFDFFGDILETRETGDDAAKGLREIQIQAAAVRTEST